MPLSFDPRAWSRLTHGDRSAWEDFAGHHALQHRQFDDAIRRAGGVPYAALPLGLTPRSTWLLGSESPPTEFAYYPDEDWLQAHQQTHEGEAGSLLIAPPADFTAYDFTNPDDFATFAWLHALEHVRIRNAIGI